MGTTPPSSVTATLVLDAEDVEALAVRVAEIVSERIGAATATKWMSVEEAASYLAMPVGALYKHTASGSVPVRRIGKRVYLSRPELDDWMDKQKEAS